MEAKHTPGPWFLADWGLNDGPNKDVIEAREPEVVAPGSRSIWPGGMRCMQIASVRDSSVDDETTSANARLIAAAPELLEALRRFANTDLTVPVVRNTFGFDVLHARAAIAKAEGRV